MVDCCIICNECKFVKKPLLFFRNNPDFWFCKVHAYRNCVNGETKLYHCMVVNDEGQCQKGEWIND